MRDGAETKGTEKQLERRVYSAWVGSEDGDQKAQINRELYEELKDKAELKFFGTGYAHTKYTVESNPHGLTGAELALIADSGNLCFGYRREGNLIIIYTD